MYYVPHTKEDRLAMYADLGITHIDELFADVNKSLLNPSVDIKDGQDMISLQKHMNSLAQKNQGFDWNSFLGAGAYDHFIPPVINTIISRGEFLSAYTPYQPEMSQGLLQAIFEYQTMITELTDMDISNASLYDGSTALWEAVLMAVRITKRRKVLILEPMNPAYSNVLKTHFSGADIEFEIISDADGLLNRKAIITPLNETVACIVHQFPNFFGSVEDLSDLGEASAANQSLMIAIANPLALSFFETPANMGNDIIVGDGQPLGVPLSYGGPYFGFLATRQKYLRQVPGRICGETTDIDGKRAFVLTLQAREQHIRREKATSNICTNQALLALRASVYMSYMGQSGMKTVVEASHKRVLYLKEELNKLEGVSVLSQPPHYCELLIKLPCLADIFLEKAREQRILAGFSLKGYRENMADCLLMAVTEKKTKEEINQLLGCLKEFLTLRDGSKK